MWFVVSRARGGLVSHQKTPAVGSGVGEDFTPVPCLLSVSPPGTGCSANFRLMGSTSVLMKAWHPDCGKLPSPVLVYGIYTFSISMDAISQK